MVDGFDVRVSRVHVAHARGGGTLIVGRVMEAGVDSGESTALSPYAVPDSGVLVSRGRGPPSTLGRMRPVLAALTVDVDTRSTVHP